jgi:hypothetical protein
LKETREQLDSVRKDNEILSNFVKVIYWPPLLYVS